LALVLGAPAGTQYCAGEGELVFALAQQLHATAIKERHIVLLAESPLDLHKCNMSHTKTGIKNTASFLIEPENYATEAADALESSDRTQIKMSAGEAITHELINIAHTRQSAQFSLGKANLTHDPDLASDPVKIIFLLQDWVRILFQTSLRAVRIIRTVKYADEPLEAAVRLVVALRLRPRFSGEGGRG
jgi:hypothetical protein